jgi:hypothetical protein
MDPNAWGNARFAEQLHRAFLHSAANRQLSQWYFEPTTLALCRFSINCMAWFGRDFRSFNGRVEMYEEEDLTVLKPAQLKRPNCICGHTIASHYSYYVQRQALDSTDVLDCYRLLAENRHSTVLDRQRFTAPDLWTPRLLEAVDEILSISLEHLRDPEYLASVIRRVRVRVFAVRGTRYGSNSRRQT